MHRLTLWLHAGQIYYDFLTKITVTVIKETQVVEDAHQCRVFEDMCPSVFDLTKSCIELPSIP